MDSSREGGFLSVGGLASGLKTDELVPAIVDKSRGPLRKLEQQQDILTAHHELLDTVNKVMVSLGHEALPLDGLAKFMALRAASSNEEAVSVAVGAGALQGTVHVEVHALAQAQKSWSKLVPSADTPGQVQAGKLTWQAREKSFVAEVPEEATLADVAKAINQQRGGLFARVVFDGNQHRLILDAEQTGKNGALVLVEEGLGLGLDLPENVVHAASDADFTLDHHLRMQRPSNIVADALDGLTLTLGEAGQSASIRVQADPATMVDNIGNFVESYNVAMDAIDLATRPNRELERGRMVGDASLRNLHHALQQAVTNPIAGLQGPYNAISQVGITGNREGRLTIDAPRLREALRQQPQEVARLFARDRAQGTKGVAVSIQAVVDRYTMPLTGVLPGKMGNLNAQQQANDGRLVQMQANLDKLEGHLRDQFSTLERNMTKMKQQKDFLDQQLKSMNPGR